VRKTRIGPDGAGLPLASQHVPFVEFNPRLLQQLAVFLREGRPAVTAFVGPCSPQVETCGYSRQAPSGPQSPGAT